MMATKRRSCDGKRRHESKKAANKHVIEMKRKYAARRLHSYHCKFCDGWHVGHKPRG
jgi:hypothetical protein